MHAPEAEGERRVLQRRWKSGWASLAVIALLTLGAAHARFSVDVHFGTSGKFVTTLDIHQEGYPDVTIRDVHYETRSWNPDMSLFRLTENYYSLRVGYMFSPAVSATPGFGMELELLHDKIYYVSGTDPLGIVGHFELSDGLNYVLLNAVMRYPFEVSSDYPHGRTQVLARAGAGPVISAPASTIRGRRHGHELHGTGDPYELAGFGFQIAGQVRRFVLPWLAFSFEAKYSHSQPSQTIAGGTAQTYLSTIHFNFGASFAFGGG